MRLEREAGHDESLTRLAIQCGIGLRGDEPTKASQRGSIGRPILEQTRVREIRIVPEGTIENIGKLTADIEGDAFFDSERTSDVEVLTGTALPSVVAVIGG